MAKSHMRQALKAFSNAKALAEVTKAAASRPPCSAKAEAQMLGNVARREQGTSAQVDVPYL